ncbi:MAG: hypothetical protein GY772_00695 [bacterium]|nr:hypothetical protein [bacterium]
MGLQDVGKRERLVKIQWCISEALKQRTAKFLMERATAIALIRDERRGRLLIRYRAVAENGELVSGTLGQSKEFGTGALSITKATHAIVRRALTEAVEPPRGCKGVPLATDLERRVKSVLAKMEARVSIVHLYLFTLLCHCRFGGRCLQVLTVDSANDEVLSGEIMAAGNAAEKYRAIAPNLRIIVRDVTHASRRSLAPRTQCVGSRSSGTELRRTQQTRHTAISRSAQKPESADEFLADLTYRLFTSKRSLTQRIEHSEVWRAEFARYCRDVESSVSDRVRNVKAAKHRHESCSKPKGRFVLYFDAYLVLAQHMLTDRDGTQREDAKGFLLYISDEVALLAAMFWRAPMVHDCETPTK